MTGSGRIWSANSSHAISSRELICSRCCCLNRLRSKPEVHVPYPTQRNRRLRCSCCQVAIHSTLNSHLMTLVPFTPQFQAGSICQVRGHWMPFRVAASSDRYRDAEDLTVRKVRMIYRVPYVPFYLSRLLGPMTSTSLPRVQDSVVALLAPSISGHISRLFSHEYLQIGPIAVDAYWSVVNIHRLVCE
ncbi:hypothetical protein BC629DRAFT_1156461 [Irpex lacteus]|nr:hypothetical protein BC629DRAFT_1156461 [Irpex lacteus]